MKIPIGEVLFVAAVAGLLSGGFYLTGYRAGRQAGAEEVREGEMFELAAQIVREQASVQIITKYATLEEGKVKWERDDEGRLIVYCTEVSEEMAEKADEVLGLKEGK